MDFEEIVNGKSNSELLTMVYELDKWDPKLLKAIEEELNIRNILPNNILEQNQKLIELERDELLIGKEASLIGFIIGWIGVFGLLGIIIGYNYAYDKIKSKYTNEYYFKYDETSRKYGKYLLNTSLIITILVVFYKIIEYKNV